MDHHAISSHETDVCLGLIWQRDCFYAPENALVEFFYAHRDLGQMIWFFWSKFLCGVEHG